MAGSKKKTTKTANKKTTYKKSSGQGAKTKRTQPQRRGLSPRITAIIYSGIAVIMLCLIFIKGEHVWTTARTVMFGLFGVCSLLIPVLFGFLAFIAVKDQKRRRFYIKLWLCVGILFFGSSLIYIASSASINDTSYFSALGGLYNLSSAASNVFVAQGGLISGILGYPLTALFGNAPAAAVSAVAVFVLIMIVTGLSMSDVGNAARKPVDAVAQQMKLARERAAYREEERERYGDEYANYQPKAKKRKIKKKKYADSIDIPIGGPAKVKTDSTAIDISLDDDGKAVAGVKPEQQLISAIKIANNEYDESISRQPASEMAKSISKKKGKAVIEKGAKQPNPETIPIEFNNQSPELPLEDQIASEVVQAKEQEKEKSNKMGGGYTLPPVQLLHPPYSSNDNNARQELENNAAKLVETLKSFGVNANIINICRGPSVTRYELQPAPGVKISKITNLSDDIALNLAANGVRIEAPIPGKAAVGIEVPNKVVTTVSMRELIDSNEFRNGKSKLTCVLGRDISGNIITTDLDKMPHLLIAGTTGSGKSVCVNSILLSILFRSTPDEVKMLLIDPKMVEFSKYKSIPHLLVPVVSDAKKAAASLGWAVNEMLQRYKTFSEYDCKNVDAFNKLVESNLEYIKQNTVITNGEEPEEEICMEVNGLPVPKERMPQIVIAIDELADLMMAAPNEVEESICRLAQMARAAGMHLVIATQRPSVNVITGVIKANIPSRISLKVSSNIDSRTILDFGGAEKLIGKGDMLFAPVGAPKPIRVQGCYASDDEIERVTTYIKKSYNAQYNEEIEEKIRRIAAEEISSGKSDTAATIDGNEVDSKMEEAIKIVIEAGQASTSMLQRRIKVGYARAGRMIDDMEQMGIVGPHQGSKPREVLMTYQQWLERSNVIGNDGEL